MNPRSSPNDKVANSGQKPGAHESTASQESFSQRTKRPGQVGLANEARPGLVSRAAGQKDSDSETARVLEIDVTDVASLESLPQPPERRPDPVEQDPDSLAHQWERETGVSGRSSGT